MNGPRPILTTAAQQPSLPDQTLTLVMDDSYHRDQDRSRVAKNLAFYTRRLTQEQGNSARQAPKPLHHNKINDLGNYGVAWLRADRVVAAWTNSSPCWRGTAQ
jgi:hypothetical protein